MSAKDDEASLRKLNSAALQVDAIASISVDPSAADAMSAPSKVLLSSLQTGLEVALGKTVEAASTEIANAAGDLAGKVIEDVTANVAFEAIADMADALPIVGAFVKIVSGLISFVMAGPSKEDVDAQYCGVLSTLRPSPTGSQLTGGGVVPADVFAPIHRMPLGAAVHNFIDVAKGASPQSSSWHVNVLNGLDFSKMRSVIGMALMAITEGTTADVHDIDFARIWSKSGNSGGESLSERGIKSPAQLTSIWQKAVRDSIGERAAAYRRIVPKLPGAAHDVGITTVRRVQFRKLRRAIQASHGPSLPPGQASDGGVTLWTAYLDLLRAEMKSGRLTQGYIAYLIEQNGTFGAAGQACARGVTAQVIALLDGWENTVAPYYAQGQKRLGEIQAQANAIVRDSARQPKSGANGDEKASSVVVPPVGLPGVPSVYVVGACAVAAAGAVAAFIWWRR